MGKEERRLRRLERRKERLEAEKNIYQKAAGKSKAGKIAYAVVAILVVAGGVYGLNMIVAGAPKYDSFAKCLTDNGAVMYGAYWCSKCQSQKAMFGSSFSYIDYVECDPRGENAKPELCATEGVAAYPTWKAGNQTFEGVQKLETLAGAAGCELK